MHLKSVTLKGFKSFADKSTLLFEPGITAIVGPNGSGKSNVTDAVLWVLGEQSAKSLRGSAMEDVIFAGSGARQPVGVAEVVLTLDNADHFIPIDFTEITVTRRMFRSGESEYLINNAPCRLLDVHDLLSDSGLGRETYSIISQGRLEEVLSSRPEDRRLLIEEAAGVLKHKKRMERALRKLGSMEAHVNRVRDVVAEVERQLKPLKRQASQAEQHKNLSTRLTDDQVALAVLDLGELKRDWETVKSDEEARDQELGARREAHREREKDLVKFQRLLEEKGIFAGDLGDRRRRVAAVGERASSGLLLLEEKGKHLVERLSDLRAKIHQSEARYVHFEKESERLAEEKEAADQRLRALYARLAELRRTSEGAKKARLAVEERQQEVSVAETKTRKTTSDATGELSRLDGDLAMLVARRQVTEQQLEAATARAKAAAGEAAEAEKALAAAKKRLAEADRAVARGETEVDAHVETLRQVETRAIETQEALSATRARILALEEVSRAFATASPAMAWILSQEEKLAGIVGVLGDMVTVDPEHERAVEAALGSDLFCVLTKTRAAMSKAVGLLRQKGAGEIAFLPLDEAAARRVRAPKHGRPVMELVQAKAPADRALAALIGDVYLMEDLAQALAASAEDVTGARFVTHAGEIVWPTGKVTVGPLGDTSRGVLTRKRELTALKDEEETQAKAAAKAEKEATAQAGKLARVQEEVLAATQERESADRDAHIAEEKARRARAEADESAGDERESSSRLTELADEMGKVEPRRVALSETVKEGEAELSELALSAQALRDEREARYVEELELARTLSECQVDIASVTERETQLRRQISTAGSEFAAASETLTRSKATSEALEVLRSRVEPVHELYAALLERATFWQDKLSERAELEQEDSVSLRQRVHELQEEVRAKAALVEEQLGRVHETELKRTQLELQVNAAVSRLVDEYQVSLESALEREEERPRADIEKEIESLRRRLASLGPVNPIALSECRSLEERAEYLTGQLDDLVASRTALTRVVSAIERKVRDRFLETFEEVNAHFARVFETLFPGGRAELFLTDPTDVTVTGIDIEAQPSGKKLKKLTLLSGGESALVAIAFLFGLYHARPSPFYILDEVEAALDDTNLSRFLGMLENMRQTTQFVIITHQRRTMESADVLYGVTMSADGVSRLASQRLTVAADQMELPVGAS